MSIPIHSKLFVAALRVLVGEQKMKVATEREAQASSDKTYEAQLNTELENENTPEGNSIRSATVR